VIIDKRATHDGEHIEWPEHKELAVHIRDLMTNGSDAWVSNLTLGLVADELDWLQAEIGRLTATLNAQREVVEAGSDLLDALLTIAPSTMYPKIVRDAMTEWLDALARLDAAPAESPDQPGFAVD
jgi:hypothetical protein